MKCKEHPSCECPHGQTECFLCGDDGPAIESDMRKFEYERMAQHIEPGVSGITTRGKYRKLLRRYGMTDDIPTKDLMRLTTDTGKREKIKEEKIQRLIDKSDSFLRRRAHDAYANPGRMYQQSQQREREFRNRFGA